MSIKVGNLNQLVIEFLMHTDMIIQQNEFVKTENYALEFFYSMIWYGHSMITEHLALFGTWNTGQHGST